MRFAFFGSFPFLAIDKMTPFRKELGTKPLGDAHLEDKLKMGIEAFRQVLKVFY